VIRLLEDTSSR